MSHIRLGTTTSPYISLSLSFGVAREYALIGATGIADPLNPGLVYEIELSDPLPSGLQLLDPIQEIARELNSPHATPTYHHDGDRAFVLGVIDPINNGGLLGAPIRTPPRRRDLAARQSLGATRDAAASASRCRDPRRGQYSIGHRGEPISCFLVSCHDHMYLANEHVT